MKPDTKIPGNIPIKGNVMFVHDSDVCVNITQYINGYALPHTRVCIFEIERERLGMCLHSEDSSCQAGWEYICYKSFNTG